MGNSADTASVWFTVAGIASGVLALAMNGAFCGLYWVMWADAQYYDEQVKGLIGGEDLPTYDDCGGQGQGETKWLLVLKFNAILYLCISIALVL